MDTSEKPKRTWWRKKRWKLALAIWLGSPILYPLSEGPAIYGYARGWYRFYAPVDAVQASVQNDYSTTLGWPFLSYTVWWAELGYAHNQSARRSGGRSH